MLQALHVQKLYLSHHVTVACCETGVRTQVAEEELGEVRATIKLHRSCKGLSELQIKYSVDEVCST